MKRLVLGLLVALAGCEAYSDSGSLTVLEKDIAADNGLAMNGLMTNGLKSNGMNLNGLNLNGHYRNGLNLNGKYANGLYKNGMYSNGMYSNGQYSNGLNLNGLNLNGMYTNGKYPNGFYNNGMFPNGLYNNGQYVNGLYTNGINANGQFPNGLSLNGLTPDQTDNTMKYMIGCAWPQGQVMSVTVNGVPYSWTGKMGLGPNFGTDNYTMDERRFVSSCMLAETNASGNHVMISIRGPNASLAADYSERTSYKYPEAYFFGDLFDEDASKTFVCTHFGYTRENGRKCGYINPFSNPCGFELVYNYTAAGYPAQPGDCFDFQNGSTTLNVNGVSYTGVATYQSLEPYWDGYCSTYPNDGPCTHPVQ